MLSCCRGRRGRRVRVVSSRHKEHVLQALPQFSDTFRDAFTRVRMDRQLQA